MYTGNNPPREEILKFLTQALSPKRLAHSLGVEETAEALALRYGADPEKAALAGLVHDCAKDLSENDLCWRGLLLHRRYEEWVEKNPALLHGPVGAIIARDDLGIEDEDVLLAVAWHTTGRAEMNTLEKIIYLADMIEPGRTFPGVEKLRAVAEEDLDEACLKALETVKLFVTGRGLYLAGESTEAAAAIRQQIEERKHKNG